MLASPSLDSVLSIADNYFVADADDARAVAGRIRAAADAERRRIERELHDGIQQDLVALAVNLQHARTLADSDPVAANSLLDDIRQDVRETLDGVRALARDVYPATLPTHGLPAAMRTVAAAVETTALGRYPLEVEETVYFCCLELLRHAGTSATVRVWHEDDALCFAISGEAIDDEHLIGVRDRLIAAGGRLDSTAGAMRGTIPV